MHQQRCWSKQNPQIEESAWQEIAQGKHKDYITEANPNKQAQSFPVILLQTRKKIRCPGTTVTI